MIEVQVTWEALALTWAAWLVPIVHSVTAWWHQWIVVPLEMIKLRFS